MNRLITIILIIALGNSFGHANSSDQEKLDSLLNHLKVLPDDSVKVFVYGRVSRAYFYMRDQNDIARKYADSMSFLAKEINFEKGLIDSYYRHGEIEIFEGNYSNAIEYLEKYLQYYENQNAKYQMVNALIALGKSYKYLGEFDKSLNYYYDAVKICEETDDLEGLAMAWNSISGIDRQMGNHRDAINHYSKANELYLTTGQSKNYAMGLQNLANVYSEIQEYDSAEYLYEQALKEIQVLDFKYEEAIILGNIGELFNHQKQPQKALNYQLKSLEIRRKLSNDRSLAFGLNYVGKTYFELRNYPLANKYLTEALHLSQELQSKDLLQDIYQSLSDVSLASHDYKSAYEYNLLSNKWKDSIYNAETAKQINELQTKYETDKKSQQITILEKETERQSTLKKAFIIGFILISLLAASVIYSIQQRHKNQKALAAKDNEIKEVNFKKQLGELELKALRAQINPHFLYNCMNSINRMILEKENENASRYLSKFSKLVRLILENAEKPRVTLQNELEMLESYINLESLRFKGKFSYSIVVDESIDTDATFLPSMVLQPFVENAIWHGLVNKNNGEAGMIKISVNEENEILNCAIEDNGIGREAAREIREKSVLKTKSMGMKITEERLKLIAKEGWERLVKIIDLKDQLNHALGTRVEINIPVNYQL